LATSLSRAAAAGARCDPHTSGDTDLNGILGMVSIAALIGIWLDPG